MTRASNEQIAVVEKMAKYFEDSNSLMEPTAIVRDTLTAVIQELRELRAANEWVPDANGLIPCPCGAKAGEIVEVSWGSGDARKHGFHLSCVDLNTCYWNLDHCFETKDELIAEWNRRANPTEENNGK